MSTVVVQIECRCGGRLDYTVTTPHTYLAAREREAFDLAHAACRTPRPRGRTAHNPGGQVTHTAENNAGRCGCCDSPLVNGACPTRWVDNDGEECSACVIPPGLSASSAPATESGQA